MPRSNLFFQVQPYFILKGPCLAQDSTDLVIPIFTRLSSGGQVFKLRTRQGSLKLKLWPKNYLDAWDFFALTTCNNLHITSL